MRCTESEDSSDLNSENLFQHQPVFISSLRVSSLVFDVLHTVINSVYVQTLPTEQATTALTDFVPRGHYPFAHACKARPLPIVGWTSLSVSSLSSTRSEECLRGSTFTITEGPPLGGTSGLERLRVSASNMPGHLSSVRRWMRRDLETEGAQRLRVFNSCKRRARVKQIVIVGCYCSNVFGLLVPSTLSVSIVILSSSAVSSSASVGTHARSCSSQVAHDFVNFSSSLPFFCQAISVTFFASRSRTE